MEWWAGLGAVIISAVVALITSIAFRWWDRLSVRWLVTGEAHDSLGTGAAAGRVRINLEVHNIGNGDAFDVRLRRCNGEQYPPWVTFEAGKVSSGASFEVAFNPDVESWETAWMEVIFRTSLRGQRSKPSLSARVNLRSVTGPRNHSHRSDDAGWGRDLPEEAGGRLP